MLWLKPIEFSSDNIFYLSYCFRNRQTIVNAALWIQYIEISKLQKEHTVMYVSFFVFFIGYFFGGKWGIFSLILWGEIAVIRQENDPRLGPVSTYIGWLSIWINAGNKNARVFPVPVYKMKQYIKYVPWCNSKLHVLFLKKIQCK